MPRLQEEKIAITNDKKDKIEKEREERRLKNKGGRVIDSGPDVEWSLGREQNM